jgi:MinD-like ATPase involved in chromosome partitioning or flagellar assembly
MVASGAAWESTALGLLTDTRGVVVLKRCVDINDLLASAALGQADVAVLALEAHGFDAGAVEHLRRHHVRAVAVTPDPEADPARARAARIGVRTLVGERDLESLRAVVLHQAPAADEGCASAEVEPEAEPGASGRVVAVWGPAGAPGRTTVALGLAAELAGRGAPTLLVDADPHAASVAQHLGVLDEVSGLLAAARLSAAGELEHRFATVQRAVGDTLRIVTGLPRPDRWVEVRAGTVEHLLQVAQTSGHVVVDTGFSLEQEPLELGSLPGRNSMTLAALAPADEIVVVGNPDPVGLARLARGLVELRDITGRAPVRVVINRMRASLGWSERDIAGMVEGFTRLLGMHFLPEDRAAADRALMAGRTFAEGGESALRRSLAEVVDQLAPGLAAAPVRRRRAGRAR